jgi:hypothetical protein
MNSREAVADLAPMVVKFRALMLTYGGRAAAPQSNAQVPPPVVPGPRYRRENQELFCMVARWRGIHLSTNIGSGSNCGRV